jgi:hypothetical protein
LGHHKEWKAASQKTLQPILTTPCIFQFWQLEKMRNCTYSSCSVIKQEEKAAVQCQKGASGKVTRSLLFRVLEHDVQREKLRGYGNSRQVKLLRTTLLMLDESLMSGWRPTIQSLGVFQTTPTNQES